MSDEKAEVSDLGDSVAIESNGNQLDESEQ